MLFLESLNRVDTDGCDVPALAGTHAVRIGGGAAAAARWGRSRIRVFCTESASHICAFASLRAAVNSSSREAGTRRRRPGRRPVAAMSAAGARRRRLQCDRETSGSGWEVGHRLGDRQRGGRQRGGSPIVENHYRLDSTVGKPRLIHAILSLDTSREAAPLCRG